VKRSIAGLLAAALLPCASFAAEGDSLTVTLDSDARTVLQAIPAEAALERFEMVDSRGRAVSYVGLTDTDTGGLVFVDKKLVGTVSHHDARAFYSCRGYATATQHHWAMDAAAWADSLLASATPAKEVTLKFTGKSTYQSIKAVVDNPMVGQVKSLVDMGTNPLNIIKTLNQARENAKDRELREQTLQALSKVAPGISESEVAAIVKPEDVSFVSGGVVMAYPRFSLEFYVAEGLVKLTQQPSFLQLSRQNAAIFYTPKTQWTRCTAQDWKTAQE